MQKYVAEIGMKRFDDPYWGPPELMTMRRPLYISDAQGKPSSDLFGSAAAGEHYPPCHSCALFRLCLSQKQTLWSSRKVKQQMIHFWMA